MKILFVCTGNTCRSPMAEALLKENYSKVEVQSAGIFAGNGAPANMNTNKVLQEKEIDLEHKSQTVTEELLDWADLVFTMTTQHKQMLQREYAQFQEKCYTLKEFVSGYSQASPNLPSTVNLDVSDPFGGNETVYRETRDELDALIQRLIRKLED